MVWKESLKQAQGMLKSWVAAGEALSKSLEEAGRVESGVAIDRFLWALHWPYLLTESAGAF